MVGGLEHFLFFHVLGIVIPTDEPIFFRGAETTNQYIYIYICIYPSNPVIYPIKSPLLVGWILIFAIMVWVSCPNFLGWLGYPLMAQVRLVQPFMQEFSHHKNGIEILGLKVGCWCSHDSTGSTCSWWLMIEQFINDVHQPSCSITVDWNAEIKCDDQSHNKKNLSMKMINGSYI